MLLASYKLLKLALMKDTSRIGARREDLPILLSTVLNLGGITNAYLHNFTSDCMINRQSHLFSG